MEHKEHFISSSHPMGGRQTYTALLIRSEIAYDINFFTYKTARITFAEVANAERKEVVIKQDTADWLNRHITSAISKIRKRISFACPRASRMASNEILDTPSQFPLELVFSNEWDGDPQVLCDTIHDYVVKQCIADWSQYAVPNAFERYQEFADLTLTEIHDIACSFTMSDTPDFPCAPAPFPSPSIAVTPPYDDTELRNTVNEALRKANEALAGGGSGGSSGSGVSIDTIDTSLSEEDGGENTIQINLSNGKVNTFVIRNGSKGSTGEQGPQGEQGEQGEKGDKGDVTTALASFSINDNGELIVELKEQTINI